MIQDHGIDPSDIAHPLLSEDEEQANARFEKAYAEAQGDHWREALVKRTDALYDANPNCGICSEKIECRRTAGIFEPVGSPAFLLCPRGECHYKAINASVERYLGKPRRNVA